MPCSAAAAGACRAEKLLFADKTSLWEHAWLHPAGRNQHRQGLQAPAGPQCKRPTMRRCAATILLPLFCSALGASQLRRSNRSGVSSLDASVLHCLQCCGACLAELL